MPNQDGPMRPPKEEIDEIRQRDKAEWNADGQSWACHQHRSDRHDLLTEIDTLQSDLANERSQVEALLADCQAHGSHIRELQSNLKAAREQLESMTHQWGLLNRRLAELDSRHPEYGTALALERQRREEAERVLTWIATVNKSLDLRKLEPKTVIGLVHELRAKADAYFAQKGASNE